MSRAEGDQKWEKLPTHVIPERRVHEAQVEAVVGQRPPSTRVM